MKMGMLVSVGAFILRAADCNSDSQSSAPASDPNAPFSRCCCPGQDCTAPPPKAPPDWGFVAADFPIGDDLQAESTGLFGISHLIDCKMVLITTVEGTRTATPKQGDDGKDVWCPNPADNFPPP
jgi:hypothetical protein